MSGLADTIRASVADAGYDYDELLQAEAEKRQGLVAMGMRGKRMSLPTLKPGDYFDDNGLLRNSSGELKETACVVDGEMVVFPLVHDIDIPKTSLSPEEVEQMRDSLRSVCFQGALNGYKRCTFDGWFDEGTDRTAVDAAFAYRDDFADRSKGGYGLILFGDYGTGKTHLAACICNAVIDMGYRARMTNANSITDRGMQRYGGFTPYMEELCRNDLVVLDDLGGEASTDYMSAKVFEAVDYLYSNRVSVIVTTNMTVNQIMRPSEQSRRVMDRLKERCVIVEVKGPNRRQMKAAV